MFNIADIKNSHFMVRPDRSRLMPMRYDSPGSTEYWDDERTPECRAMIARIESEGVVLEGWRMAQSNSNSSKQGWTHLSMSGDSLRQWRFIGGQWGQDKDGVIRPPHNLTEQNLALFTGHAYGDFEAEFEFRWDIKWTTGALLFRAQDATHYYVVDFPAVGQQYRAEHFWGTVSKVDERNWREGLHMQMVHGVSSLPHLWHRARVEAKGDEIRVWCDDRPLAVVRDKTYSRPGFVGLTTYSGSGESGKSSFRNLRIRGLTPEPPRWDESTRPARNWGVVDPDSGSGCSNIVRASSGDLLVVSDGRILRSADNGRSWAADDTDLPEYVRQGREGPHDYGLMRQAEDGRLEVYSVDFLPPFTMRRGRSDDHGSTWSRPRELGEVKFPEGFSFLGMYTTRLVETHAGTLLMFAYASNSEGHKTLRGRTEQFHGVPAGMNFCLRSTDNGMTWSEPIDIDGPPYDDTSWTIRRPGSEISVTQTANGDLLALVRPWTSPMMWESWSHDDGKTWTPLARGPFPMYACYTSIITTTSGVVLIAGRFPGIGMQVSRDNGMTWQFYQIDRTMWANGAMYEVEPDLVTYIYGGGSHPQELRYQVIRVTPNRVEPVR